MVPFESLGTVSYSPSIVTIPVSVAVCEIFSIKEWCDLENRVRVPSRSLEVAPFDRSHTSCRGRHVIGGIYDVIEWSVDTQYYLADPSSIL